MGFKKNGNGSQRQREPFSSPVRTVLVFFRYNEQPSWDMDLLLVAISDFVEHCGVPFVGARELVAIGACVAIEVHIDLFDGMNIGPVDVGNHLFNLIINLASYLFRGKDNIYF